MRTLTAAQTKVLEQTRRATFVRLKIDRTGSGDWVDLSDLEGWDWIQKVRIGRSIDNNLSEANIDLKRSIYKLNLATFDDNSKLNIGGTLVDVGQKLMIETATVGLMGKPTASDWVEKFRGEIDVVDSSKSPIRIRCRDQGSLLADRFIETQQKYPADPATSDDVESIMQAIIDNVLGPGVVDLYSVNGTSPPFNPGDSPGWVIAEYIQKKQHLLHALSVLANQIGWDLRYRWHAPTSAYQLVFYEPERTKTTPDWTFEDGHYFQPDSFAVGRVDVRNAVRVAYTDAATGNRVSTLQTDAASITKYGRRYMEIAEGASSQIDSATEANALASAALSDLKEPFAQMGVSVLYFWPAELGDLYRFKANNRIFSSDQDLAVVSISDDLEQRSAKTTFTVRGTPSGGKQRWLEMEGRTGVAPSIDLFTNEAADNPNAVPTLGGVIVTYDDPRSMSPPIDDWATTQCHVSTVSGFTPGPSTLKGEGRQTRFEITGLIPDETYYVKLLIIDEAGNVSATSVQQVTAAAEVGPYSQNLDTERGNIVPNGDFGARTQWRARADFPPDRWASVRQVGAVYENDLTIWGSGNEIYDDETIHETGQRSILINPGAGSSLNPGIRISRYFPVSGGFLYVFLWNLRTTLTSTNLLARIEFLAEDRSTIVGVLARVGTLPVPANTWYQELAVYQLPSTARFARAMIVQDSGTGGQTYVDLIAALRALPSFRAYRTGLQTGVTSGTVVAFNDETNGHDHGSNYDEITNFDFVAPHDGDYSFESGVEVANLRKNRFIRAAITVNGIVVTRGDHKYNWGTPTTIEMACMVKSRSIQLVRGDSVKIILEHSNPSPLTINGGETLTYFTGSQNKEGNA